MGGVGTCIPSFPYILEFVNGINLVKIYSEVKGCAQRLMYLRDQCRDLPEG
jgi:hypothetical protein